MTFPKSYDIAVSAVFTLTVGGPFTNKYNNRADLEMDLKLAHELGFMKNTVGMTTSYYPLANVASIAVTDI